MPNTDALWDAIRKLNRRLSDLETLDSAIGGAVPGHHLTHENGAGDEISVAGLSGELADDQPPKHHASTHNAGGDDMLGALQWLQLKTTTATISGGAITVTSSRMVIDTEGGAASDDLTTINGLPAGDVPILILRSANTARDVVVKDGTGNIQLAGDFTLGTLRDNLMLIYNPSGTGNWTQVGGSNNG